MILPALPPLLERKSDERDTFRSVNALRSIVQPLRVGQFSWSSTIPAATVRIATFTSPADPGIENLLLGMAVAITPPASLDPLLQVDAYVPADGQLVLRVRNATAAPIAVAGLWSYLGYVL